MGPGLRLAVLGCSDGKYVLPAARRGIEVIAVDIDEVSLFGGTKVGVDGSDVHMPGLVWRLAVEGLGDRVTVVHDDLATVRLDPPCDLVFISGAIQYAVNLRHSMTDLIGNVQACVAPGGRLFVEYMLPVEARHQGRANYLPPEVWTSMVSTDGWTVTSNRVAPAGFDRRTDVEVRAKHRYTQWGFLHAVRTS
jgi:cyclopropane fatty-acyl-phospholipid synthase-like methyltransferase